jgi:flagellar assembly protein FliH
MQSEPVAEGSQNRSCGAAERIELFEYPADPDVPPSAPSTGWAIEDEEQDPGASSHSAPEAQAEQRLEDETRRAFAAGREQGCQEERKAQTAARAAALEQQKRQMAALAGSFALERERYLEAVEGEVVRLALAVAARILRREAQMDPLLLTGAVRVALGQLPASTEVKLRVPPADFDLWREAIALLPNLPARPEVVRGEELRLGECLLEAGIGTVDLGIRAQLAEIERGFFDRPMARRPDPSPAPAAADGERV